MTWCDFLLGTEEMTSQSPIVDSNSLYNLTKKKCSLTGYERFVSNSICND
jgi:hypothetical protein